jgi:putative transposase
MSATIIGGSASGGEALRLPQEKIVLDVLENLQGLIWSWIDRSIKGFLKEMVEGLLEEELNHYLKAGRYERTCGRKGYRNGHYKRKLLTRYGPIEALGVPRAEGMRTDFQVFDRYQRKRQDVELALGQLFLQGVSTRRLRGIARELFGQEVSPTTVSRAATYLDEELRRYQEKPLSDDVEFLFLDGITQKVRELGVEGKTMLCAFGIYKGGRKELLSFRLADAEDTDSWRGFLVDLKSRGLIGKNLKLITADGNPALLKALKEIYPFKLVQRCIAHKLRNVAVKLKRSQQKTCLREAKGIFAAESRQEALRRFKTWKARWHTEAERAVKCLEKDLYHCLHYYQFPKELWKTLRTTNILERAFREVRRRTRPMGVFSNAQSANRIMYGVTDLMNQNWKKNPLTLISTK